MEIFEMLTAAGLGTPDARVYLALYRLQEAHSGRLAAEAAVPTSKIYAILNRLIARGLVSVRLQNNTKVFQAAPPDALAALIEEKERALAQQKTRVVEAISQLKRIAPLTAPYSRYKYYEGINGIKSLWNEIDERMRDDTLLIRTGKRESYESLAGFYSEFHKRRVTKNVPARIIFPIDDKEVSAQRKRLPLTQVRFAPLGSSAELSVVNDLVAIQHLGKEPHGFLLQDPVFAAMFRELLTQAWDAASE